VLSPELSTLSDLTDAEDDVVLLLFLLLMPWLLVVDLAVPFCSRNFRNESSCILR
jgi:hypothetical protein